MATLCNSTFFQRLLHRLLSPVLYERERMITSAYATLPVNFHFHLIVFVSTRLKSSSFSVWTLF